MRSRIRFLISIILWTFFFSRSTEGITLRLNSLDAEKTMKDLRAAEATYKSTRGEGKYGTLKDLADSGLIGSDLARGIRHSYRFEILTAGESYSAVAVPLRIDDRYHAFIGESFYLDDSGIIRAAAYGRNNNYRQADKSDQPTRYQQ